MRRGLLLLVVAMVALLGFAAPPAHADEVLDFTGSLLSPINSINWNGSSTGTLTGTGIPVTEGGFAGSTFPVSGFTCGSSPCGLLAFQTGTFMSSTATSITFNGGGSLTITGNIHSDVDDTSNATLVSATFSGPVTMNFVNTLPSGVQVWHLSGPLTILALDESVLDRLPAGAIIEPGSSFHLTILLRFHHNGGFSGRGTSADVAIPVLVPEPASMVLLGSGLVAVGSALRRKRQRS